MISVLCLCLLAVLVACGGGNTVELAGTDLGGEAATDFTLTDQRGETVQLSDFQGRAVALTFIFTNCPDVCPLIAQKFRRAYEQLPADLHDDVAMLAVSVDPERDDPAALRAFSEKHGLADNPNWFALTADRATLEPIWSSYYIGADSMNSSDQDSSHDYGDHSEHGTDATSGSAAGQDPTVIHTDAIIFIDGEGNRRSLLRSDALPDEISSNLRALAEAL